MTEVVESCENCLKPPHLCVCDAIKPVACRTRVLILQHPQEPDIELGTAKLSELSLSTAKLTIGLSWPNLKKALGAEANPKDWLVLYLGSAKIKPSNDRILHCVNKEGKLREDSAELLSKAKGLIVIDGTWSQAKTIWWRNAWLTKVQRVVLTPKTPSIYGKLRREPKRESLSTLEAIGMSLSELERNPEIFKQLLVPFRTLLQRKRDATKQKA